MRSDLPARQSACLAAIEKFSAEHGYSPSHAELAAMLSVSEPSVRQYLDALERKGFIQREYRRAGTLRIVKGTET